MSTSPRRPSPFVSVSAALLGGFFSACSGPTEIVLQINSSGTAPSSVIAKLQRTTPFSDNPPAASLPPFVTSYLDGAALGLVIGLSGSTTSVSLLPAKDAPTDLRVTLSAGGYAVSPATPQDAVFVPGASKTIAFTISAPLPDLGAPKHDMAAPHGDDAGVTDLRMLDATIGN